MFTRHQFHTYLVLTFHENRALSSLCLRFAVMDNTVEPALKTRPEGLDATVYHTNSSFGEFCRPSQEH